MHKEKGIIYIATNRDNGMRYVGQTTKTLKERKRGRYRKNSYFTNALRSHEFDWREYSVPLESMDHWERWAIAYYGTLYPNGYNFETGGHENKAHCEETRAKLSAARKGKKASEETRTKLSLIGIGNKNALGYKHTAETRIKMSATHKGKKNCLGYKHTEESQARMSAAKKGKPGPKHSEETKAKIAAARKAYQERKKNAQK